MTAPCQWLLQQNHPNLGSIAGIGAILHDLGRTIHHVRLEGFSDSVDGLSDIDLSVPTVCYGPSFVPRALGYPGLVPGIFFDPERFRHSAFSAAWGGLMLSTDARPVPLSDVIPAISRLGSAFVRPDEDSKMFDGGVYDAAAFAEIVDGLPGDGRFGDDPQVIVASHVGIDAEWRTFVVDGEVVAASSYRSQGRGTIDLHVPHDVVDLAFEAAAIWQPAQVFCLDIARSGDRLGIVEANCFNASRFYGADAAAILEAVSNSVEATFLAGRNPSIGL